MDPARRAFYEYHATLMEPWDGPACVDLHRRHPDRRGPRPQRPAARAATGSPTTAWSCSASEAGVLDIDPAQGRPQGPAAAGPDVPGRHRRGPDRRRRARSRPRSPPSTRTRSGCTPALMRLDDLPPSASTSVHTAASVDPPPAACSATPRRSCGSSSAPMARDRRRAARLDGHRHADRGAVRAAAAALRLLHASCSRRSPTRRSTRSARSSSPRWPRCIGPERNLLDPSPATLPPDRAAVPGASTTTSWPRSSTSTTTATCPASPRYVVRGLYDVAGGGRARCARGSTRSARRSSRRSTDGARFIVLSDRRRRRATARRSRRCCSPPPCTTTWSGEKTRTQVGLVVEAGDVREVHHVALLIGYGAAAVNPYLAIETVEDLVRARRHRRASTREKAVAQPDQGARQGRAQGDVEDGHLDRRLLHRRADLRGDRPRPGGRRRVLHRHRHPARRRRPRRDRRGGRGRGTPRPTRDRHRRGAPARWTSAASTSGAARASRTCSTRRPSSGCSTRPAPRRYDIFKQYTARGRRPGASG